nr:helix-turn-helix domain-containing protein [uncultured Microbacterium sp.]
MLRTVAVPIIDGLALFEFGVICEVFGGKRDDPAIPHFDFRVCAATAGQAVSTGAGVTVSAPFDFSAFEEADLIAVPAAGMRDDYPPELLRALRRAADQGKTILSICSGAFILGAAGLLDGRSCVTHWKYIDALRALHPLARVRDDALYVEDGNLVTSAGTAAGVDASLHVVRRELGANVANVLAQYMVVSPHREGGQRQFVERPVPRDAGDGISRVLEYMASDLTQTHSIEELAAHAHLSPRSFTRRFQAEAGTTPGRWLASLRLQEAQLLLETTTLDVDEIARCVGYASGATLRKMFTTALGRSPSQHRIGSKVRDAAAV